MANVFIVYKLIDPRDGCIFYVGKGLEKRPRQHIYEANMWLRSGVYQRGANRHKVHKIAQILRDGFDPVIEVVASYTTDAAACSHEQRIIEEIGLSNLTNMTPGGESPRLGVRHTAASKEKMRQAKLGKKQSSDHVAKVAAANRGRRRSAAFSAFIAARNRELEVSAATRRKIAEARASRSKYPIVIKRCASCGEERSHKQRINNGRFYVFSKCDACRIGINTVVTRV